MKLKFEQPYLEGLRWWMANDPLTAGYIVKLVRDTESTPMKGLGEPRLVHELGYGIWARHISGPHFLIYMFELHQVTFISCRAFGGF